ncbi:hypothetical protein PAPYR_11104 [Paratrimastix pyriformis]|uniref:Uncharacterized protein n=1 Tax=Paratrimastix pyriformis TaxID=342808 RepID=A0ABQ8UA95_9EUKA|nr:hypothetical protein PAPYR_11104 [Paratrimastix pyriformis]
MGGFWFPEAKGPVQEVALFFRDAAKVPAHFPSPDTRLPEFLSCFSMPVPFYFAYRAPISLLLANRSNSNVPTPFCSSSPWLISRRNPSIQAPLTGAFAQGTQSILLSVPKNRSFGRATPSIPIDDLLPARPKSNLFAPVQGRHLAQQNHSLQFVFVDVLTGGREFPALELHR